MNINLTEKKAEAIKRMKLMKLLPNIIHEFDKDNIINYSETAGVLYWVHNHPEWTHYIKKFEKKYKALVYHAEFSRLEFGDCLSLFYISDYEEEWAYDEEGLKDGYSICFVWNISDSECSEFGAVAFKPINGGIKRTA